MQMNTFDTLSTYESLVNAGFTEPQAKEQTRLLALAAKPEVDLKEAFDKIDKKFDQIDRRFELIDNKFAIIEKDFSYIRVLGMGIIVAIIGSIIKGCL